MTKIMKTCPVCKELKVNAIFKKMFNTCIIPYSWSRNGRKLLSAATDNTVSLWDVTTGEVEKTFRFPSPILKVQFHPRSR